MLLNESSNFSLVDGGATQQLLKRLGRRGKPEYLFYRAAAAGALIAWLPLLILSIVEGVAWGDRVTIPFFYDVAAYTRFLIAVPLLVIAESIIDPRLGEVALHFMRSGRITEKDYSAYREAVEEVIRLRDSKWAEGIIVIVAYLSVAASMMTFAYTVSNWRWTHSDLGVHFTLAAWWYAIVSMPIFHFLFYRWFLRIFNWARFLYRMSRLDLRLTPTHSDRAGGIAFVGANQRFFGYIAFAFGSVFAGVYANEVLYRGLPFKSIQIPALVLAVLVVFLIQLPGLFFFSTLRKTKRSGVFAYGTLALQYTSEFQEKWIEGHRPADEQLMGSGDVQSLADLSNSYAVIEDMKIVPFTFQSSIWLGVSFLVPVLPLTLTVMPLDEILQTLFKLLA